MRSAALFRAWLARQNARRFIGALWIAPARLRFGFRTLEDDGAVLVPLFFVAMIVSVLVALDGMGASWIAVAGQLLV